uniref:Uncharacterized protein n=1 Tax=Anguilla anguilla TaxID=7936 RepID=A0A0E9PFV2_ANGAN
MRFRFGAIGRSLVFIMDIDKVEITKYYSEQRYSIKQNTNKCMLIHQG